MGPDTLSAIAGAILSLLMNYIPGLNTWFDKMSANGQRLAMAGLLALAAVGSAVWTCTSPEAGGLSICLGETNWRAVIQAFVFATMANQATDRISPKARVTEPTPLWKGVNKSPFQKG